MRFQQYNLKEDAERVLSYIDNMTDRKYDRLHFRRGGDSIHRDLGQKPDTDESR